MLRFGKFDDNWNFNSQMTIANDGKIGINTDVPDALLHLAHGEFRLSGIAGVINFELPWDATSRDLIKFGGGHMAVTGSSNYCGIAFYQNKKFTIWRRATIGQPSSDVAALVVSGNGMVGIGNTNPANILTIQQNSATDPIADAWTVYSSRRWKTNIQPISNALDQVKQLQGVRFDWKETGKSDIGLIAEDVGKVVPEVVAYEENGVDAQSVDYARLVSVLIEGMKEQQKVIEQQQKKLDDLIQKFNQLGK
jgi:hypothetical protein